MAPDKGQLNARVSAEAHRLMSALQEHLGDISQAAVLELALRALAKREGVTLPSHRKGH